MIEAKLIFKRFEGDEEKIEAELKLREKLIWEEPVMNEMGGDRGTAWRGLYEVKQAMQFLLKIKE